MNKRFKPILVVWSILLVIIVSAYLAFHDGDTKEYLKGNLISFNKWEKVSIEGANHAFDQDYIPKEEELSQDSDDFQLVQEAKDALYNLNIKVTEDLRDCSTQIKVPCSFDVYRAYEKDYLNNYEVNDHLNGYAVDLKLPSTTRGQIKGHSTGDLILELAPQFGFTNPYQFGEKRDDAYSHFEYVGVLNAQLMLDLELTKQQYINALKLNRIYTLRSDPNVSIYKRKLNSDGTVSVIKGQSYQLYQTNSTVIIISRKS